MSDEITAPLSEEKETQPTLFLTGCVRDLVRAPLVTLLATDSIQEAAQRMSAAQVSAAVIPDAAGQATGIVTDWDLRERVVAAGRSITQPIQTVMSSPIISLAAAEPIYEAVRLMLSHHIHHLLITSEDQPLGLITSNDLMVLHSASFF
ncbi:MAG: CBS domain-containing protein, partial [Anaerolineales bacterium]|nr:CBS domain-containing protein [Anaerolineales bacterium]